MVNCFRARTFLRQWLQWYLLSPSKASTAVKRFKALVRESARTISRLKSSRGSYVLEQVEQTVHLTCNNPADGQLTGHPNKLQHCPLLLVIKRPSLKTFQLQRIEVQNYLTPQATSKDLVYKTSLLRHSRIGLHPRRQATIV
jgi:hypothetical protein